MQIIEINNRFTNQIIPQIYNLHTGYVDHINHCQRLIDEGRGAEAIEGELTVIESQEGHKALVAQLESWLSEQGIALPGTSAADVGITDAPVEVVPEPQVPEQPPVPNETAQ